MTAVADALEQIARDGGGPEVVDAMKRVFAEGGLKRAGQYLIEYFGTAYQGGKLSGPDAEQYVSRVMRCIKYPRLFVKEETPQAASASLSD